MKKTNSKKGFTLVELVIVIAVIAILSAILVPTFSSVIGNANKTKEKADLKAAITTYIADHSNDGTDLPDFNKYAFVSGDAVPESAPTISTTNPVYRYNNGEITEATTGTVAVNITSTDGSLIALVIGNGWVALPYTATSGT